MYELTDQKGNGEKERIMKKFRMKKLLAVLLAVAMMTLQSAPAFATEGSVSDTTAPQETVTEGETGTETGSETETPAVPESEGEEAAPAETPETVPETQPAVSEDEAVPEEQPAEEISEPAGETVSDDAAPAEETGTEETVSEDAVSGNEAEGYLTELTPEQEKNAEILKEEIEKLTELKPDEDYVPNEAVFLVDTEEEAKKIAESYGGELEHFALGVATVSWKDRTVDTVFKDVVKNVEALKKAEKLVEKNENGVLSMADLKAADEALYSEVSEVRAELIPEKPVEPNYVYHIDAVSPEDDPLYGTDATDISKQWFHVSVSSAQAWAAGADGTGVKVAVIDTGIDTSNNDLSGNHIKALYSSMSFDSGEDDNGHGTHCSGIVAAIDNNVGGLGVAPSANIISIKAGDYRGSLKNSDIDEAIQMAIKQNVNVISMSFGGSGSSTNTEKLLKNATEQGITCVAAAGNESTSSKRYPGAYACTLCVGAYDYKNNLASYSNYGDWVDVCSPGSDIYATMPDDPDVTLRSQGSFKAPLTYEKDGCSYGRLNGTSMATPCVAGIAALVKGVNKGYTAEQVKNAIMNSAPSRVYKNSYGTVYRGVDAYAALTASTAEPKDPDEQDDGTVAPPVEQPETSKLELGVGPQINVAQGKSVDLGAVVLPSTKTKIVFKATGDPAITVTAKGVVKVAKTAAVGATSVISANCGLLSASTTVPVIAEPTSADFTLTKSHEEDLSVATGTGKNSVDISVTGGDPDMTYRFKVSNKNVALFSNQSTTISAKGGEKVTLFAAGNGNVNVTAFATDGSGKKASVKVKCITPITDLKVKYAGVPIEGSIRMAVGGKLKLKPASIGTKVSKVSGKVQYTWEGPYVNSKGVIKPGEEAYENSFDVTLTAVNNGITKTKTITIIVSKDKKLKRLGYLRQYGLKYVYLKKFTYTGITPGMKIDQLYEMPDITNTGWDGPYGFTKTGNSPAGYNYSTNNGQYAVSVSGGKKMKILSYGEYGVKSFKPLKAGNYKVTYTSLDGSGKKFSFTLKVR